MTTTAMREQLIEYLKDANEKKIVGLYSLLEEDIEEKATSQLTEEQLRFLDEERKKHHNGESKSYSWEEVKGMIRNRKAS